MKMIQTFLSYSALKNPLQNDSGFFDLKSNFQYLKLHKHVVKAVQHPLIVYLTFPRHAREMLYNVC